jgi:hypothetical protein
MADRERWDGWLGPKQWMPIVGVLSIAVIALGVMLFLNMDDDEDGGSATQGRVPTHEHADFALFIRGQKFDFNTDEFMTSEDETPESDNVHLHEPRSSVVHVHTTLTTWDEFLTSIGFRLDDPSFPGVDGERVCMTMPNGEKLCNNGTDTWKFIVNGVAADGVANVNIGDLARVLISYGPETAEQVMATQWPEVSDEACIPSGLCLKRGTPEEETCGSGQVCAGR